MKASDLNIRMVVRVVRYCSAFLALSVGSFTTLAADYTNTFTNSYTINLKPGWNLIANHLDRGANNIRDIFPVGYAFPGATVFLPRTDNVSPPSGLKYLVFTNGQSLGSGEAYDSEFHMSLLSNDWSEAINDESGAGWSGLITPWLSGDGMLFVNNSGAPTYTFYGTERMPSYTPKQIPAGACCLLAAETLTNGTYEIVTGRAPVEGTRVYRHDASSFIAAHFGPPDYSLYTFTDGHWIPEEPVLRIGEAAWYCAPAPALSASIVNDQLILSWPEKSIAYTLQSTEGQLGQNATWFPVSAPVTTNAARQMVMLPYATNETRFFRLKH